MVKNKRESNIELLRIVSMVLVLVVHADFKALGLPSLSDIVEAPITSFIRFLVESISIVCVNIFVLISGWFSIKFKLLRLNELLFQILFFCGIMGIFFVLCEEARPLNVISIIKLFCEDYWFILSYIILYLFAPSLNYFVEQETKKNIEIFLVLFFLFQTLFGFVYSLGWFSKGYSPLSFMGLYVLGRYLHLYPSKLTKRKRSSDIIAYTGMVLLLTCFAYWFTMIKINPIFLYSYSSPVVIIATVYLFLFFSKLSFKSNLINWVALSCFSIFLVHCFPVFFEKIYLFYIKEWYVSMDILQFLLQTFLWIMLFMVIPVVVDKFRLYLWDKVCNMFRCY